MHSSIRIRTALLVVLAALCLFTVGCSAQTPEAQRDKIPLINSDAVEPTPILATVEPMVVQDDRTAADSSILVPVIINTEVMRGDERNVKFDYTLPKTGIQSIDNGLMMFCNVKLLEAMSKAEKDGAPVELYLNLDVYEHDGGGAFVYTGEMRHSSGVTEEILFVNHYDMESGKEFSLMDVFPPEQISALRDAFAQRFAEQYPNADQSHIADTVMPIFAKTQNFIHTDSGLVYLWLANEIDPSASWIAQAFLTNDELQTIIASSESASVQSESPLQSSNTEGSDDAANANTASDDPAYLVTDEINEDALTLITNMFSKDGVDYITLDYVQLKQVDTGDGYSVPVAVNTNPKLRTFEVASDCRILLPSNAGTIDMDETNYAASLADLMACYDKEYYNTRMYFEVQIKGGKLVSCELWTIYYFAN